MDRLQEACDRKFADKEKRGGCKTGNILKGSILQDFTP